MVISWLTNRKIVVTTITAAVAVVTTIVRFTGGFESLEVKRYDYFFSKRAISKWDDRIVIIGYTEDDAKKYGDWLPDEKLTQVLKKVQIGRPTTVGLFFRREAKPASLAQRELLNNQIKSMPFLIKASGNHSFTPEKDNIVRKVLLYKPSGESHIIWAIAKHYLQIKGAEIQEEEKPRSITIKYSDTKEVTIKPLSLLNDGGYHSYYRDLVGFQTLISWPFSARTRFTTYSFEQIINNPPPNLTDKIVIISGQTDRNLFKVPINYNEADIYNFLYSSEIAGLAISNILNQAEVPFVQTWSDPIEYLYLYGWLIASAIMILWLCEELDPTKKWAKYLLSISITWVVFLLSIYVISLVAFPRIWIPSVFVGRGISFTILFGSLVCLEFKVREEQNKNLEKQKKLVEEQKQRIIDKEKLEKQQKLEIAELKKRLLAEARLAFLGRLNAGYNHEIKNILFQIDAASNNSKNLVLELVALVNYQNLKQDDYQELVDLTLNNIEIISTQVKRSKNLRQQILPDTFNLEDTLPPDLVDLGKILNECIKLVVYSKSSNETIAVEKDYQNNLYFIEANIPELNFVFISLLSNAWDAIEEKVQLTSLEKVEYYPQLKIKVVHELDNIIVTISDNGISIPKEKEKSIFEFFYTTKLPSKGTGLGLSLAKDIITARHQGDIYLKQELGWKHFLIKLTQTYAVK
ncbi:MAG: CHASE2 domain-containing protein [Crocosphaera sp.]